MPLWVLETRVISDTQSQVVDGNLKVVRSVRPRSKEKTPSEQIRLFGQKPPVLDEILKLDISSMTPLEAITKLYELQRKAKE
jgi:hypothetical protein